MCPSIKRVSSGNASKSVNVVFWFKEFSLILIFSTFSQTISKGLNVSGLITGEASFLNKTTSTLLFSINLKLTDL